MVLETGVGGGKKALLGTLLWAPLGGGASDVKLIPPDVGAKPVLGKALGRGAEGNRGAGGIENVDEAAAVAVESAFAGVLLMLLALALLLIKALALVVVSVFPPLFWIVDVKLASKAATASGDNVCEKDKGGNGTLPGAGATNEGYG